MLDGTELAIRRAFGDETGELAAAADELRQRAFPQLQRIEVPVQQRTPEVMT